MALGPTYTVTIKDSNNATVQQPAISASSFLAALVIAITNQLVNGQIANVLNNQLTMTVTVTNP